MELINEIMNQKDPREDSASPQRPQFPSKLEREIKEEEEALKKQLEKVQQKKKSL